MKKKLTTVTLLLASVLIATSCDSDKVTLKETDDGKSIIFSIKTEDGVYTADQLLSDLQDSSTAKTALYNEVARKVFTQYGLNTLTNTEISNISMKASDQVDDFKENCKSSAKEEGTDYDTYLETALKNEGVSTTEELEQLYYDNLMKQEVLKSYVEEGNHYNYFLDKYLDAYTPYQVKHILVAANTADTSYVNGTMTADNARKLLTIMDRFLNGDSFESIATLTDDTSSAQKGGVMPFNEAQNYVSEFRFATYAQQIFANNKTVDDRYAVAADLHIVNDDSTSSDYVSKEDFATSNLYEVYQNGIETVKLSDILALKGEVTSSYAGAYNYFETDAQGNVTANKKNEDIELPTIAEQPYEMNVSKYNDEGELNKKYYEEYELQRNQIFNNTLNTHKVKWIELSAEEAAKTTNKTTAKFADGSTKTILADDAGNPIFFALASTGIHFMSIVWNSYDPYNETSEFNPVTPKLTDEAVESLSKIICVNNDIKSSEGNYTKDAKAKFEGKAFEDALNQAYFTLYDNTSNSKLDTDDYQYTYIGLNGAYKTKSTLKTNSNELLADITSYVSNLEYYVFDSLVYEDSEYADLEGKQFSVTFYDDELNDLIKEFVQDKLGTTDESFASSVQSSAETYASKLAREAEVKAASKNWGYVANKN